MYKNTGAVPSSDRILEDVERVLRSLEWVREARVCIIDESLREGSRFEATMKKVWIVAMIGVEDKEKVNKTRS